MKRSRRKVISKREPVSDYTVVGQEGVDGIARPGAATKPKSNVIEIYQNVVGLNSEKVFTLLIYIEYSIVRRKLMLQMHGPMNSLIFLVICLTLCVCLETMVWMEFVLRERM